MSRPRFRFTLNNSTAGSLVIKEPGGWDNAVLKLERNNEYYSLVEFYEQPLTFWSPDGGYDYIKNIDETQGVNANIEILIEISDDFGSTWDTVFDGLLALDTKKEIDFYKLECGVIRNDFWSKFITRKGTPVNIQSTTDLDGNAVSAISSVTLNLPSQKIRKQYSGTQQNNGRYTEFAVNDYGIVDFNNTILDEIEEKYEYFPATSPDVPFELLGIEEDGTYTIDCQVSLVELSLFPASPPTINPISCIGLFEVKIQINDLTPVNFAEADAALSADGTIGTYVYTAGNYTEYTHTDTYDLKKGDQVRIYIEKITLSPAGTARLILGTGGHIVTEDPYFPALGDVDGVMDWGESFLTITADTVYPETTCEAFLIHDVGQAILDRKIGGSNRVYSEYFGSQYTNGRTYSSDGCAWRYALTKGLHIRQYTLSEKPIYISFDDFWSGANAIFNLGLGYEQDPDTPSNEVIRIEPKEYFFDSSSNSVTLSNINNIEVGYETDLIFKKIEIGYQKWESENIRGIDDPQTKHTYATIFNKIGKEISFYSKFIGASLAWETTRRKSTEKSKDWRLDNDLFILSLNTTPAATDVYNPELDENYASITGLLNSEDRYNSRITPGRNFLRWRPFFNGCLQLYFSSDYVFSGGEGNTDMVSNFSEAVCDGAIYTADFSEKQNIDVTASKLFTHNKWEFEHPLTWTQYKSIRDNRTRSIGLSRTGSGHQAFFVIELSYEITSARAKFKVLKA